MNKRIKLKISFELPEGATKAQALNYAIDAVGSMHGCLRPDNWDNEGGEGDPMFYLNSDTVKGSIDGPLDRSD